MTFSTVFRLHRGGIAPIHAFLEFFLPVLCTILFPSSWLLSHINIVETMDSGERGMNPVTMTIIIPQKEYWPSRGSNKRPPVFKSEMLPTELWGSAFQTESVLR